MRWRAVAFTLAAAALGFAPVMLGDRRLLQLGLALAYTVAVLGLGAAARHGGRLSLGHGAFMAVGAYATAIAVEVHGAPRLLALPIAAGIAGALGLAVVLVGLRLPRVAVPAVTLGLAFAAPPLAARFAFTGGGVGFSLFGGASPTHLYVITWLVAAGLFLLLWAVQPAGLPAFVLSAAYAGVAGALYALDAAFVSPGRFPVQLSLILLAAAALGLYGSIWGALLGGLAVEFSGSILRGVPPAFVFGVVLVALVLAARIVRRV